MAQPPAPRHHAGPVFLRGLDHPARTPDGWTADCPICRSTLEITPDRATGHWHFDCQGGCDHDELVDYLQCSTRLDQEDTALLWRAIMLAPRIDVCEALVRGEHVPVSALDTIWARRFRLTGRRRAA